MFLSFNEANNGLELWKTSRCLFAVKLQNGILQQEHCFCPTPFLFLEIQKTGVINYRHKSGSVYNPTPSHHHHHHHHQKILLTLYKSWAYIQSFTVLKLVLLITDVFFEVCFLLYFLKLSNVTDYYRHFC